MKRLLAFAALAALAPLSALTGCSALSDEVRPPEEPTHAVVHAPYHEHALYNYNLGRLYMSQGRYELARERFLFVLAVAENGELKDKAAREVEAAERLIISKR